VPLHVSVNVHSYANINTRAAGDTGTYNIEFFIEGNGAYIKAGGDEMVINDSLVLFIDTRPDRMLLYQNKGHLADQIKKFSAAFMQDSNLQKMASRYQVFEPADSLNGHGTAVITLQSRGLMRGTVVPRETIEVRYKKDTKQPVLLTQVHRNLIPLDSANYNEMKQNPAYAGKLVHPAAGLFFVIKELTAAYTYNAIDYGNMQLPLQITNCLIKNPAGHYIPVGKYETFKLLENL
jgi:hypothetical protein